MSFILDALKKSESDRQRQATPGLIDVSPVAPRPRFPLWALAIGALLGVNLVVLIVVLTRADRAANALAGNDAAASGTQQAGANFSPMDTPVYAPEIPVPPVESKPKVRSDLPARTDPSARYQAPTQPEPRLNRAAPERGSAASDHDDTLPTLDDMIQSGQKGMPELHLDIHVYDAHPANRFVFINMHKYREGASLQEGPNIEHITRAGVVLNYQGRRFILPRQ